MFVDLAEAGFAGTEVAGWYPSKKETKEKADAAGLTIVAQWFSSFIVRDGVEAIILDFRATCEYLRYLGATRIVVSEQTGSVQGVRDIYIFDNKPVLKDEEWPVLTQGLNKLGEIAHKYGLDLVYHHHLGTVIQTKDETLRLLELTDPDKVSLLFDTGHAFVGDGDVIGLLRLEHLPLIGALAPVVRACAWAGRRLAACILQRVFEPLVIAATVPLLVSQKLPT
ncbi:TIM barrel protein [Cellulomonas flavigena]|uniref:TIM barrel protein n=1 Tax=Cellulomonas flavigena TaxID=1711 RepID=UPI0019552E81|nr:TIM barrel protein [Cellulomonas flavigena]